MGSSIDHPYRGSSITGLVVIWLFHGRMVVYWPQFSWKPVVSRTYKRHSKPIRLKRQVLRSRLIVMWETPIPS